MAAGPRSHRRYRRARDAYRRHAAATSERCHLCGDPIDYRLSGNHPDGWTLEHVTPLTDGGRLLDPANYASAHRRCQARQGGRLQRRQAPLGKPSRRW